MTSTSKFVTAIIMIILHYQHPYCDYCTISIPTVIIALSASLL